MRKFHILVSEAKAAAANDIVMQISNEKINKEFRCHHVWYALGNYLEQQKLYKLAVVG